MGGALIAALVSGSVASASGSGVTAGRGASHATISATKRSERSAAPDALANALSRGKIDRAEYALERALTLFDLKDVRNRFGDVERPDPHDATLLLRDLVLHKNELAGSDRLKANRILARPSDGPSDPQGDGWDSTLSTSDCDDLDGDPQTDVCFSWVFDSGSSHYATTTFVNQARMETARVWNRIINGLGYKQPKGDGNSAGEQSSPQIDIYFADIGDDGLYGYCTSDEPDAASKKRVSAYCVLDNDYSSSQFNAPPPEVSGPNALKVTLTHEFFHAIQFNYDWREAPFLMEGTAVWMEDQIPAYDDINASYAYIFDSILHQPEIPLDAYAKGDDGENFEYGAFVFFTWLAEAYGAGWPGTDASIVRAVWNKAGARKQGIKAIQAAITQRGYAGPSTPFRDFFAGWGAASYYYDAYYEEGWDNNFVCNDPTRSYANALRCSYPPHDAHFYLPTSPTTGWQRLQLDRRSTRYVKVWLPTTSHRLKVEIDLPKEARGGEASVVIWRADGSRIYYRIELNDAGNATRRFNRPGTDEEVILALTNTGPHSGETYKYKVTAE